MTMTNEPKDGWPETAPDAAPRVEPSSNNRTFTVRFDQASVRRAVIATMGILVAFSILKWLWDSAGHFIFLFMLAWLLSIAMEPSVAWFSNHGIKRSLASALVIFGMILASIAFMVLFGGIFVSQSAELIKGFPETIQNLVVWLNQTFNLTLDPNHILDSLNIDAGKIAEWASTFAGGLFGILALVFGGLFDTITMLVFAYYLSADGPRLRRIIGSWLPARMQKVFVTVWDIAVVKTGGFVVSKVVLAALSALFHVIAFYLIGVPFWLPMGIFAGIVAQFIPTVGTYIGIIIPALFTLAVDPVKVVWIVVFATIYQQIESYVFTPRVSRATMDVHPAIALGAVFVGVELFGPIGAIIGIPLAAAIIAIIETYRSRYELVPELTARTQGEKDAEDAFAGDPNFVIPAGKPLTGIATPDDPTDDLKVLKDKGEK
jgi:predicted PurR-regulated permease PerM